MLHLRFITYIRCENTAFPPDSRPKSHTTIQAAFLSEYLPPFNISSLILPFPKRNYLSKETSGVAKKRPPHTHTPKIEKERKRKKKLKPKSKSMPPLTDPEKRACMLPLRTLLRHRTQSRRYSTLPPKSTPPNTKARTHPCRMTSSPFCAGISCMLWRACGLDSMRNG